KDAFDAQGAETFGADSFQAAKGSGAAVLRISLPAAPAEFPPRAAFGARLAAYRFDKYRTTEKPEKKPSVVAVEIAAHDPAAASAAFAPLSALADAVLFARDLVSEPANILHPEEFARRVKALESLGLEVEIVEVDWGEGVPVERYADILAADAGHKIKAVLACHNET
ncbi:hypothetical protein D1614_25450, partial [Maribellus luteus]